MLEFFSILGAIAPSLSEIARFLEKDPSIGMARYLLSLIARLLILIALIAGVAFLSRYFSSILAAGTVGTVLMYVGLAAVGLWMFTATVRLLTPRRTDRATSA